MIKKDFSKFINISGPDVSSILSGINPDDVLDRIKKLSEEVAVYKKLLPDIKNVQFIGTYAIIETHNRILLMDLESGRVYYKKRFICLLAVREHKVDLKNEYLNELRETYGLDEKKLETLSKIYHLASEESKTIQLIKSRSRWLSLNY